MEPLEPLLELPARELGRRRDQLQRVLLGLEDFLLLEGSDFSEFGVCFDDDLASQFLERFEVDGVSVGQFLTEEEDLLEEVLQEDIGHLVPVFFLGVVLDGEDDGKVIGTGFQEPGDVLDGFLEVDGLAEGGIADRVVDDGHVSVVVDV